MDVCEVQSADTPLRRKKHAHLIDGAWSEWRGRRAAHRPQPNQFADFDPRRHYALTLAAGELSETERNAAALAVPSAARADDIDLDLP